MWVKLATLNSINKLIVFIQAIMLSFTMEDSNWQILVVFILLYETVTSYIHDTSIKFNKAIRGIKVVFDVLPKQNFYSLVIFIKFIFAILLVSNQKYEPFFILVLLQTLIYFFNKDSREIYYFKINTFFAIAIVLILGNFCSLNDEIYWNILLIYMVITLFLLHIKIPFEKSLLIILLKF